MEQKRGTELDNKLFLQYLTTKMPSRGHFVRGCEKALCALLSTLSVTVLGAEARGVQFRTCLV